MKTVLTVLLMMSAFSALAQSTFSVRSRVVVRDEKFKPQIRTQSLDLLLSTERVEGLHFKVVAGTGDDAVAFSDDPAIVLRAATVYYHLNKARDFYVHQLKSNFVRDMGQLVVRVNLQNQYNDLGHFSHEENDPQFNNALTVPAGEGYQGRVKAWNVEIWFRPLKRVHIDDLKVKDPGMGEWGSLLTKVRDQSRMTTLQRFISQLVSGWTNANAPGITWTDVIRTGGTSLMLELVYNNADTISDAFSQKWFWLDTALVPEIIYHEYSHVALSDHLVLSHSTAVIEGMADYFAGVIANSPNLATKIRDYNSFNGKKAKRNHQYQVEFETTDYANSDFVFGMLWDLRSLLGEDKVNDFIYSLRTKIENGDSIRRQFIDGILNTCEEQCQDPFVDKLKILKRYNKRGI